MFRGFKLPVIEFENNSYFYEVGLEIYEFDKVQTKKTLDDYISPTGVLDGAKMEGDWFPQVDAHIFISHSHGDKDMAISLAGWLYDKFHIKAFIDSCIWGYADDLLRSIDNLHCRNLNTTGSYNYTLRNYSTSHVHMMLSTALSKMIDKTECMFFLNTPKSIMASEIEEKTLSPWIYSEIETSRMIRINLPQRPMVKTFSKGGEFKSLNENFKIKYPVNAGHLTELDSSKLNEWTTKYSTTPEKALDELYDLLPPLEKNKSL